MFKDLIKHTSIYMGASLMAQGLVFLLWIALAWLLPPADLGLYALIVFVVELFSVLGIMGLDSAITKFYHSGLGIPRVLISSLGIMTASLSLSIVLFWVARQAIQVILPEAAGTISAHVPLLSAVIFSNTLVNIALVHYTATRQPGSYALFQVIKTGIFCALAVLFAFYGYGLTGILYALFLSTAIPCAVFLLRVKDDISYARMDSGTVREILVYGYPLMLYGVFGIVITYFSRLVLPAYVSIETLGVYNFFFTLVLQINGLWGSFNRAWTPEIFSQMYQDRTRALEKVRFMVFLSSAVYLALFVGIILLGKFFLFDLVLKPAYLDHVNILYVLLLGPLFTGIYTAAYPLYYYDQRSKTVMLISSLLSVVNMIVTVLLIRTLGQEGAALSYAFMAMATTLLFLLAFKSSMNIPRDIITWTVVLAVLMTFNIALFLRHPSPLLFSGVLMVSLLIAVNKGNLITQVALLLKRV